MITSQFRNGVNAAFPRTFNQLFDQLMTDANGGRSTVPAFMLRADAFETPEAYEIQAAVPGFSKDGISLELNEGKLTLSGERKPTRAEDQKYHLLETGYGRFSRTFLVPENVNTEAISASFENGMLRVRLPKDEQKVQRRKIEIETPQATVELNETAPEKQVKKGNALDTKKN